MSPIYIQDPPCAATSSLNLPPETLILVSPVPIPRFKSIQDFLTWLQAHPEFLTMIIMAILSFLGAATATLKTTGFPAPPVA